jgi:hypothetical protein
MLKPSQLMKNKQNIISEGLKGIVNVCLARQRVTGLKVHETWIFPAPNTLSLIK